MRTDIQLYIIDNLNFLNSQLGGGPGEMFDEDELVVGGPGGVLQGLQLTTGDLVVGGATAPVAFPVGPNGQVLMASGGNLELWHHRGWGRRCRRGSVRLMPFTTPSLPDENGVTTISWLKEMLFDNIRFIACQLEAIPEGSVAHGVGEPGFEGSGASCKRLGDVLRRGVQGATDTGNG